MKEKFDVQALIDAGEVKITKVPPGRAFGSGDLRKWAHNRQQGLSGVADSKTKGVCVRCRKCGFESQILISIYSKPSFVRCRSCGERTRTKIIKKNAQAVGRRSTKNIQPDRAQFAHKVEESLDGKWQVVGLGGAIIASGLSNSQAWAEADRLDRDACKMEDTRLRVATAFSER